jgi:N-acyl-D-aspartate/D-glutamate deacylase
MNADIVIRGGTVIDGTGAAGRIADVGIANGRPGSVLRSSTSRRKLRGI